MATASSNEEEHPRVVEWYKKRSILLTGATGFLGKVMVEKILRVCPPEKMYLLLRPKRGRDTKERLEEILNCQIFDHLRDAYPERLSLVCGVKGDILQDELGISHQDRQELIKECGIIFHCAANVRFDQTLKGAVITNTLGTKRVLKFAKEMQKLDAFVHVSTAFCHTQEDVLEEKCYPAPQDPNKIIDLAMWMDDQLIADITPQLTKGYPNTYAYSKCLSEQLVSDHAKYFPIVITRPSIVVASWKEPFPGWIENLNGPTGLIIGAGKGVIRSMHCNENYAADILPVDVVSNALIVLGWRVGTTKPKEPLVCNVTESGDNPITWGHALSLGRKHMYDNPFSVTLWYPDGSIKSNWFLHMLCVIFFHFIPAYFIDLLLVLLRKKPFMVKVQKRISVGLEVLQYYTIREWKFKNKMLKRIPSLLNSEENDLLYTDISCVRWDSYLHDYVLGAREYCCKEDPANLPQARKLLKRLYYLNQITSIAFYLLVLFLFWTYASTLLYAIEAVLSSTIGFFGISITTKTVPDPL